MNSFMSMCHETVHDSTTHDVVTDHYMSLYSSEDFFDFVATDHYIFLLLKLSANQSLHVCNNLLLRTKYQYSIEKP
jgi:hypothetical protein